VVGSQLVECFWFDQSPVALFWWVAGHVPVGPSPPNPPGTPCSKRFRRLASPWLGARLARLFLSVNLQACSAVPALCLDRAADPNPRSLLQAALLLPFEPSPSSSTFTTR
jgi:hypothetical protein